MTTADDDLRQQLKILAHENGQLQTQLTNLRITAIESQITDHEKRIRPLEDGAIKANTIYALFAGNGLLSLIALVKIFVP